MDDVTGTTTKDDGRARAAAGVITVLTMLALLGGCSRTDTNASTGAPTPNGSAASGTSATATPSTAAGTSTAVPTTAVRATTSTVTGTDGAAARPYCAFLEVMFSTTKLTTDPKLSEQEAAVAAEAAQKDAPDEAAKVSIEPILVIMREAAEGNEPDDGMVAAYSAAQRDLAKRAPADCPDDGPFWACSTRSTFKPIGPVIGEDPPPSTAVPTPEGAVDHLRIDGPRIEVLRTDDLVRFGWLDENGSVKSTRDVTRQGDAWVETANSSCR